MINYINEFIKKNKIAFICIVAFILIFVLNFMSGYTSDDYAYRFVFQKMPVDPVIKIDGIRSIFESQVNHYNTWNGRFFSHSLVQFFMQYDKMLFNVLNSIAFILLSFIVLFTASKLGKINNRTHALLFSILLIWLFTPDFGKTVLWVSGSGNYLWMSLFYTSFVAIMISKSAVGPVKILFILIVCFLAGATNENSGPSAILMSILFLLFDYVRNNKIYYWKVIGVAVAIIGSAMIIISPGSKSRGGMPSSIHELLDRIVNVAIVNIKVFFVAYILMLIMLYLCIKARSINKENVYVLSIFAIGHFASIYSMSLSPYIVDRALFGAAIFLIIPMVYLANTIYSKCSPISYITTFLLGVSLCIYYYAFLDIRNSYFEVRSNISTIKIADKTKNVNLKMMSKPLTTYNPYNGTANITPYSQAWFNQWMAQYYGVKSITGVK